MPELPPHRSLGHLLRDANRAFQRKLAIGIMPYGVPLGHWYVFRVLWQEDGLSQTEIAQRAGISTPTVMVVLKALQAARHVRRSLDPSDRRKNVIYLTPSGRALESRCLASAKDINERATSSMSPEDIETLSRLLRDAVTNLQEDNRPQDPGLDPGVESAGDEGA